MFLCFLGSGSFRVADKGGRPLLRLVVELVAGGGIIYFWGKDLSRASLDVRITFPSCYQGWHQFPKRNRFALVEFSNILYFLKAIALEILEMVQLLEMSSFYILSSTEILLQSFRLK